MKYINDFDEVKKNWASFWKQEFIGRPFVCVTAGKLGVDSSNYFDRLECAKSNDFVSRAKRFENSLTNVHFAGEAIPFYTAEYAPDQYASFYGAEIFGNKDDDTTWVHPVAGSAQDLDCRFNADNMMFQMLLKNFEAVANQSADKYLIGMTDLHSNLDALSALLSPQNLCMELLDCPETVEMKLNELNDAYPLIYDALYKAGRMDERGVIGWSPLFSEKKFAVVQCDFSCMISPDMARKYVIPSIEREIDYLDHSMYHYDGKGALGHIDDILALKKLQCVQWCPGAGEKRTIYWMDLLKKIQGAGKSLWIYDWTVDEILADNELDPAKTVFSLHLESRDDADGLIEKLIKKYR